MSVDANVLINERIREELRDGVPAKAAIAAGYDKASGTIADANLTAMLAGVALFAFGTGPVKGFAVSLIAGIVTSMYTAVSVRSEEHTSELQSLMRISYAVLCLKKKKYFRAQITPSV